VKQVQWPLPATAEQRPYQVTPLEDYADEPASFGFHRLTALAFPPPAPPGLPEALDMTGSYGRILHGKKGALALAFARALHGKFEKAG
jgi:hypothetical protein